MYVPEKKLKTICVWNNIKVMLPFFVLYRNVARQEAKLDRERGESGKVWDSNLGHPVCNGTIVYVGALLTRLSVLTECSFLCTHK